MASNRIEKKARQKAKNGKVVQEKKKKSVNDMTIEELMYTKEFQKNLEQTLVSLRLDREMFCKKHKAKRHVIDELIANNEWNVGDMSVAYAEILCKASKRPATERKYISLVVSDVYGRTIQQLQGNENAELLNNRKN